MQRDEIVCCPSTASRSRHSGEVMGRYIFIAVLSVLKLSADSITVTMSGSLNSPNFNTLVENNSGFVVDTMSFELSGTSTFTGEQLVVEHLLFFSIPNGIAAATEANPLGSGFSTFGFALANLYSGNVFTFGWDAGTPSNADYEAVAAEAAGIKFTARTIGGPTITGVMQMVDDKVTATAIVPTSIPEPAFVWLVGGGVLGLLCLCSRSGDEPSRHLSKRLWYAPKSQIEKHCQMVIHEGAADKLKIGDMSWLVAKEKRQRSKTL